MAKKAFGKVSIMVPPFMYLCVEEQRLGALGEQRLTSFGRRHFLVNEEVFSAGGTASAFAKASADMSGAVRLIIFVPQQQVKQEKNGTARRPSLPEMIDGA